MTANKGLKRAARARAQRTGESYTAARYRLLAADTKELTVNQLHLRRIADPDLGFSIAIADDWEQMPPRRNTHEVFSAMARPNGRPFVAVSKMLAKTEKLRDNVTLDAWVDVVVYRLTNNSNPAHNAMDLTRRPDRVGGEDGIRLDYRFEAGGESLTTRAYWVMRPPAAFMLAFGTFDHAADEAIINQIADTFGLS